jgi:hypothetical protein
MFIPDRFQVDPDQAVQTAISQSAYQLPEDYLQALAAAQQGGH